MEPGLDINAFKAILSQRYPDKASKLSDQFERYLSILSEVNAVMDLTAIKEPNDIREKHFLDSLLIENSINQAEKVADIGSGAGFPGLCLAIVRQDCVFDLIEPTTKRCTFLQRVIKELGLTNVDVINARAEDLVHLKGSYDVVTARAVAQLSILLELGTPLLKVKGRLIAMKGSQAEEELKAADKALAILNLILTKIEHAELPSYGPRTNLIFTKVKETSDKYPRPYRLIKKTPL
jgi:16S rRNA (guanine527-N7)-methyltransferase